MSNANAYFGVTDSREISNFLYSSNGVKDFFRVNLNRICHLFNTGVWINETVCLNYCAFQHIDNADQITSLFNRTVAQRIQQYRPEVYQTSPLEKLRDGLQFIKCFLRSPSTIGSIFPSSSQLTKKIIRQIPNRDPRDLTTRRYLEVGAGTGVFTEQIIKKLKPTDHLDLVEFDPALCQILRRKFGHLGNVTIHEVSILDFQAERYDVIVSGLPLNAFRAEFVDQVFQKYLNLAKAEGYISYFEYMGLAKIKRFFLRGEFLRDFDAVLAAKQRFVDAYGRETDSVWPNLTPARVLHCRIPPANGTVTSTIYTQTT